VCVCVCVEGEGVRAREHARAGGHHHVVENDGVATRRYKVRSLGGGIQPTSSAAPADGGTEFNLLNADSFSASAIMR
jgi:hypothetical protein